MNTSIILSFFLFFIETLVSNVHSTREQNINVQAEAAKAYHNIALDVNKVTALFHNEFLYPKAQAIEQENTYDYVVVGSGGYSS